jgi:hypothetical protein
MKIRFERNKTSTTVLFSAAAIIFYPHRVWSSYSPYVQALKLQIVHI